MRSKIAVFAIVVVLTACAFALNRRVEAQAPSAPRPAVAPQANGRYQLIEAGGLYMIDSQTGRVWRATTFSTDPAKAANDGALLPNCFTATCFVEIDRMRLIDKKVGWTSEVLK